MRTSVPQVPLTAKSVEGAYRDGPWYLPLTGGWLPSDVGSSWNWWQNGYDPITGCGTSAIVESCVSAYSQTTAMCPGDHWRRTPKGGRERVANSALARILRKPNDYQSISDFMLNLTRRLYEDGNAYGLCLRNDRFEISEIHLMNSKRSKYYPTVTGEIFYDLGGNDVIQRRLGQRLIVPARDVLHVKLHTDGDNPIRGLSPLGAAWLSIAAGESMNRQQLRFYANQSRPSQVLGTDMILNVDQVNELREMWRTQSQGLGIGGTPILTAGLKPLDLASTASDSQLAEVMKHSDQDVALAFRIPLQILGIGGTPFASTEAMMQSWIAQGLGFCLNHIEEAIGRLFALKGVPDEYVEFDTDALLRSALKDRVEAYASGTRAGIFAPNEARAQFELETVEFGDEPRMQQQDVPLSYGAQLDPNPAPAPAAPAADPAPPDPKPNKDIANDNERLRQSFRASRARNKLSV